VKKDNLFHPNGKGSFFMNIWEFGINNFPIVNRIGKFLTFEDHNVNLVKP
jgi:hypothetical protein